jgi:hypothetical protein
VRISGNRVAPIEAKVVLVHILRRFEIITPQKCEDVKIIYAATAAPHPDIVLGFKPRHNTQ